MLMTNQAMPPAPVSSGQPGGNNPYDFILNHQGSPKRPLLGGNSFKQRLLIVAGGGLLLIIVLMIAFSVLFNKSDSTTGLLGIAQSQTEIARVAELGKLSARSPDTKNFASLTSLSMATAKAEIVA